MPDSKVLSFVFHVYFFMSQLGSVLAMRDVAKQELKLDYCCHMATSSLLFKSRKHQESCSRSVGRAKLSCEARLPVANKTDTGGSSHC